MSVRRLALLGACATCLIYLAACETDEPSGDVAAEADETDPAEDSLNLDLEGTLTIGGVSSPGQWDPHRGVSESIDYAYHTPVYDSLLELTPDLTVGPWLARDWEVSDDGLTYTFVLREDVEFHDGERFDAAAAVTNLERARGLEGALTAQQLAVVESVEAVDDFTLEVRLNQVQPTFPFVLAWRQAGRMVSPAALQDPEHLATNPVGSGPYRLLSQTEERAVYERANSYWNEEIDRQLPANLERVIIPSDEARYRSVREGNIDIAQVLNFSPELEEMRELDEFVFHTFEEPTRRHKLAVNYDLPPFDNPRVRRALNMAIDREGLEALVGQEQCGPTASPVGAHSRRALDFPDIEQQMNATYAYDPDGARQLLREAGVEDLEVDILAITVLPIFDDIATAVQAQLGELGITANIEAVVPAEARNTFRDGEHHLFVTNLTGYPDVFFAFDEYFPPTSPAEPPEEMARLVGEAQSQPLESEERHAAFERAAEYLLDDPLDIILCTWPNHQIGHTHVRNLDQQSQPRLQGMPSERYLQLVQP